jgi:hypothetical protein
MCTTRDPNPPQVESDEKRAYEGPAIVWEETLEIAGTLRASNVSGEPGCGDEG